MYSRCSVRTDDVNIHTYTYKNDTVFCTSERVLKCMDDHHRGYNTVVRSGRCSCNRSIFHSPSEHRTVSIIVKTAHLTSIRSKLFVCSKVYWELGGPSGLGILLKMNN